jgi:hypothetical protein
MSSLSLRGMLVMPVRRGVPVTPAEPEWIIKRYSADPTSGSLREAESEGHACHAR